VLTTDSPCNIMTFLLRAPFAQRDRELDYQFRSQALDSFYCAPEMDLAAQFDLF